LRDSFQDIKDPGKSASCIQKQELSPAAEQPGFQSRKTLFLSQQLRTQIKKEMTKVLPKEISDLANQEAPEIDVRRRHKVGGVEE
jgi:hypothetical protein